MSNLVILKSQLLIHILVLPVLDQNNKCCNEENDKSIPQLYNITVKNK